ncbi:MAG: hypothetical protein IPO15_19915 [Anaerolineae bacterium]|uniref:hypothetical protein n=1 Tax=Candidatus Amarolinea dominans TaxID=3140696 RepID=UPI003135F523|nr:hypothetical protein [Anaerolineae bacterium]
MADTLAVRVKRGYALNKALDVSVRSLSSEWAQTQSAVGKQLDEQAPALARRACSRWKTACLMMEARAHQPDRQPMVAVVKTTLQAEGRTEGAGGEHRRSAQGA